MRKNILEDSDNYRLKSLIRRRLAGVDILIGYSSVCAGLLVGMQIAKIRFWRLVSCPQLIPLVTLEIWSDACRRRNQHRRFTHPRSARIALRVLWCTDVVRMTLRFALGPKFVGPSRARCVRVRACCWRTLGLRYLQRVRCECLDGGWRLVYPDCVSGWWLIRDLLDRRDRRDRQGHESLVHIWRIRRHIILHQVNSGESLRPREFRSVTVSVNSDTLTQKLLTIIWF